MAATAVEAVSDHPAASSHLPFFVTAPGDTDVLMVVSGLILLSAVVGFGIVFLHLHSLPERIAHKNHKIQFEVVAILCLLALFTHIHLFWMIALLLAVIELPDFSGLLGRMAASLEALAGRRLPEPTRIEPETPVEPDPDADEKGFIQAEILVPIREAKLRKEKTHA
jgi:hypothetical protein